MPVPINYHRHQDRDIVFVPTLRETEDESTLLLPPPPRWTRRFGIIMGISICVLSVAGPTIIFLKTRPLIPLSSLGSLDRSAYLAAAVWLLGLGFWIVNTVYVAVYEMKFGDLPNVFTFGADAVIITRHSWWGMKTRTYPFDELSSVHVEPVKDIFGRKRAFALRINRREGRRIVGAFSTRQPELPEQIQRAFSRRLDHHRHATSAAMDSPG